MKKYQDLMVFWQTRSNVPEIFASCWDEHRTYKYCLRILINKVLGQKLVLLARTFQSLFGDKRRFTQIISATYFDVKSILEAIRAHCSINDRILENHTIWYSFSVEFQFIIKFICWSAEKNYFWAQQRWKFMSCKISIDFL